MSEVSDRIDQSVSAHATVLSERLQVHRAQLFPPNARKALRKVTLGEAARLSGKKRRRLPAGSPRRGSPESHRGDQFQGG